MGFNLAFKGIIVTIVHVSVDLDIYTIDCSLNIQLFATLRTLQQGFLLSDQKKKKITNDRTSLLRWQE